MKRLIGVAVLAICLSGCGGSSGGGGQNPDVSGSINISSITGDGATADIFDSALIIEGEGFTDGMTVELGNDTKSYQLDYQLESSTKLVATLPADLQEGDYEVSLTDESKNATAPVTILKGDKGDKGDSGLFVEQEFSCGPSGDIDNTTTNRFGQSAQIIKFSDGSYSLECMVGAASASGDSDTSTFSSWFASNSVGVNIGVLGVAPFYVTCGYSIANNSINYVNQADTSQFETVACTQIYP